MKKYKLIKKYPMSNEIGYISNVDYSDYPEYWEDITNIYYLVFSKKVSSVNAWEPIIVESFPFDREYIKYFKSLNEAEEYILLNKPDISIKYLEDYYNFEMVELRKKIKDERAQDK
jgi:hypothetical protein